MNPLYVKDMILEAGRPKIAMPITGRTHEEILRQAQNALKLPCDILEWRVDCFLKGIPDLKKKIDTMEIHLEIVRILDDIDYITNFVNKDLPLIFAIRSEGQGGEITMDREDAYDLAMLAAQSNLVDMIDMELFEDDGSFDEIQVAEQVEGIRAFGVNVILSYYDYDSTPTDVEIENIVAWMRNLGADIPKIVGLTESKEEAAGMLKKCHELTQGDEGPMIMVATGLEGAISRIVGGKCGSCITYATADTPTAEGQYDVKTMATLLDEYYK